MGTRCLRSLRLVGHGSIDKAGSLRLSEAQTCRETKLSLESSLDVRDKIMRNYSPVMYGFDVSKLVLF